MVYSLTSMKACTAAIGLLAPICLLAQVSPDSWELPAKAGLSHGVFPSVVDNPPVSVAPEPFVFANYQAYVDAPVLLWRESNDRVRQVGGWRAYARQAQSGDVPDGTGSPGAAVPSLVQAPAPQALKP